jgi:hypothetical protein
VTAKIIPFPSQHRVRLAPAVLDDIVLPAPVLQLLAIMEQTERGFGSISALNEFSAAQHLGVFAPCLA